MVESVRLVVLYVDLRKSTLRTYQLNPNQRRLYYGTFLNEMISVINDFGGYPYKTVGDCVVGFFPERRGFGWIDNTITCGLMMIEVVKNVVSPFTESNGLPPTECRIGSDCGEVIPVKLFGAAPSNIEVVGNVMNIAAKIQSKAETNTMYIGQNLCELIYTDYRLKCKFKGSIDLKGESYKFYRVDYQV